VVAVCAAKWKRMFDPKLPTFYHKNANNQFSHVHNLVFLQLNGIFLFHYDFLPYVCITILCRCVYVCVLFSFDSKKDLDKMWR
jgi:hypothetical protein